MIIHSIAWWTWKIWYKDESIFSLAKWTLRVNVKVEWYLSYCATNVNLKWPTDTDTSTQASKTDLASLQNKVNKLDVDPVDLSKLSNAVDNDIKKKKRLCMINCSSKSILLVLRCQVLLVYSLKESIFSLAR